MMKRTGRRWPGVRAVGVGAWPGTGRRSVRADGERRAWGEGEPGLPQNPALLPILAPFPAPVPDPSRALGRAVVCSDGGSAEAAGAADDEMKTRKMKRRRRLKSGTSGVPLAPHGPKLEPGPGRARRTHSGAHLRCCRCCGCAASVAVEAERRGSGACRGSSGPLTGTQREGH